MDLRGAETGMERVRSPEIMRQSWDFKCCEGITGRFQVDEEWILKYSFNINMVVE